MKILKKGLRNDDWVDNQLFVKELAISALESGDTMGERIGRIGRIRTDFFFCHFVGIFCRVVVSYGMTRKNPFVSARSAQSVLPLYRFLKKETF
jgi:hypothetical protein